MKVKGKFSSVWRVGIAVVLAASLGLVMAAPAVVASPDEIFRLSAETAAGTACWDDTFTPYDGDWSVKLDHTVNAGSVYLEFVPEPGITLSDLEALTNEWSFWYHLDQSSWGPYLELKFTSCGGDFVDITIMSQTGDLIYGEWTEVVLTTSIGGVQYYGNVRGSVVTYSGSTSFQAALIALEAVSADWSAADWELTRVQVQLWEAADRTSYIDDITIDGTLYAVEQGAEFWLDPDIAYNVKTAQETFTAMGPCGPLPNLGTPPTDGPYVVSWSVERGCGSGDVTTVAGGVDAVADPAAAGSNFITVRMNTKGDAHICVTIDPDGTGEGDGVSELIERCAEKKWGDIYCTELTKGALVANESCVTESVEASFLWDDCTTEVQIAADGAVVDWWLMGIDAAAAIQALEAALGNDPCDVNGGCGTYTPDFFSYDIDGSGVIEADEVFDSPRAALLAIYAFHELTPAEKADNYLMPDVTVPADETHEQTVSNANGETSVTVHTEALTSVILATLTDYPIDKNGQNPVCVQHETWILIPPPHLEKVPQVAWAGEKVTLEQSWGTDFNDQLVSFQLEHPGLGTLEAVNAGDVQVSGDLVYTQVIDGVARCILDSEDPGQADVKVVLREDTVTSTIIAAVEDGLEGIVVQSGLVVYYLKLESITPLDPDPAAVLVGAAAEFGIEVKGWFTSSNTSTRVARSVDYDGDGAMDAILPAGRWVMPDDWRVLAGADWVTLRPHWDIMDAPDDDITSQTPHDEWGPYDSGVNTPTPPGEAEYPVIGPFSLLQPFAATQWMATAAVPADATVILVGDDLRCTVVPDGELDAWDCPMPPAEIIFNADSDLSSADKGDIYVTVGAFTAPFYASEIPATQFIPPMVAGNGYEWDSWDIDAASTVDEGPYDFWTDLGVSPLDDEALEVYSDNHGIAYVAIDALSSAGSVIISATADYPYLTGKHGAMKSDEVTQTWRAAAPDTCTWSFSAAGFFPRHLPDSYTGEVVLADLVLLDIPAQVQGVWYYDDVAVLWIYWAPGVGGDLLVLEGGLVADYNVLVSGACDWIIPLP